MERKIVESSLICEGTLGKNSICMKVKIVKKQTIYDYVQQHASSRSGFHNRVMLVDAADWNSPNDLIQNIPFCGCA
jgi:hypothetical protein